MKSSVRWLSPTFATECVRLNYDQPTLLDHNDPNADACLLYPSDSTAAQHIEQRG